MMALSCLLYILDYFFFGKGDEIVFGFIGNLAFLPIYVLFVTLMIENILKHHERQQLKRKMNIVIGVFFSEAGNELLRMLITYVREKEKLVSGLGISDSWQTTDFKKAANLSRQFDFTIQNDIQNLADIQAFLFAKRQFVVSLMENPNLLEHTEFTDTLWAILHLTEELTIRKNIKNTPKSDLDHLRGDIRRAVSLLLREWIFYMKHLKKSYPYLFSLAVRMNPVLANNDPVVHS